MWNTSNHHRGVAREKLLEFFKCRTTQSYRVALQGDAPELLSAPILSSLHNVSHHVALHNDFQRCIYEYNSIGYPLPTEYNVKLSVYIGMNC